MLSEERITITAKTVVDDKEIASYQADLRPGDSDWKFYERQIDKEACKEHRYIVRADRATFEDLAYHIQEEVEYMKGE